jgi:hypothetical protein
VKRAGPTLLVVMTSDGSGIFGCAAAAANNRNSNNEANRGTAHLTQSRTSPDQWYGVQRSSFQRGEREETGGEGMTFCSRERRRRIAAAIRGDT